MADQAGLLCDSRAQRDVGAQQLVSGPGLDTDVNDQPNAHWLAAGRSVGQMRVRAAERAVSSIRPAVPLISRPVGWAGPSYRTPAPGRPSASATSRGCTG